MKPIEFPGVNVILGKNQPEYQPLPVMVFDTPEREMISCWELTDEEVSEIVKNKKIYFQQMTFGNPFQPVLPMVNLEDGIQLITE